eukprot:260259_1
MSTDSTSFGPRKIFGATLGPLIYPLLIIALSGDYYWVEGWLFGVLFVLMIWSIMLYLYIHDPALLKERMNKSSSDQDPKDKWIFKLISAFYIPWLVIIPLDAKRYKWSQHVIGSIPFFWVIKWFNLLLLVISFYILYLSFVQCTFLSPVVRIQKERKQTVISDGMYGVIRHPMYCGAILMLFSTPLFLGSLYGLVFAVILFFVFDYRTTIEEKMLQKGLDGYTEYQKKVKYKFIPYIY